MAGPPFSGGVATQVAAATGDQGLEALLRFRVSRLVVELGEHVRRILVTGGSEATKLHTVAALASQFHQDVGGVAAAVVCQPSKLVEVAALAGQLDQLSDGVAVALLGQSPQLAEVGISHPRTSHVVLESKEPNERLAAFLKALHPEPVLTAEASPPQAPCGRDRRPQPVGS